MPSSMAGLSESLKWQLHHQPSIVYCIVTEQQLKLDDEMCVQALAQSNQVPHCNFEVA